jgi:hypothetical protein
LLSGTQKHPPGKRNGTVSRAEPALQAPGLVSGIASRAVLAAAKPVPPEPVSGRAARLGCRRAASAKAALCRWRWGGDCGPALRTGTPPNRNTSDVILEHDRRRASIEEMAAVRRGTSNRNALPSEVGYGAPAAGGRRLSPPRRNLARSASNMPSMQPARRADGANADPAAGALIDRGRRAERASRRLAHLCHAIPEAPSFRAPRSAPSLRHCGFPG